MKGWTEKPEIFYEDKSGSSVYLSICLSVHLSVITSYSFPFSDSKLTQPPPVNLKGRVS